MVAPLNFLHMFFVVAIHSVDLCIRVFDHIVNTVSHLGDRFHFCLSLGYSKMMSINWREENIDESGGGVHAGGDDQS